MKYCKENVRGFKDSVTELIPCLTLCAIAKGIVLALFTNTVVKAPSRKFWGWSAVLFVGALVLEAFSIIYPKKSLLYSEVTHTMNGQIALTFDDGPSTEITPRILDLLKKYNVTGTFFVLGHCARRHPELLRRIIAEGHTIGIHSDRHKAMLLPSAGVLSNRIEECRAAIRDAIGDNVPISLFRPPYGYRNAITHSAAKRSGVKVVMWSVDSMDYMLRPASYIANKVLRQVRPGDVILMHDAGRNIMSADALELILQGMTRLGYTSAAM